MTADNKPSKKWVPTIWLRREEAARVVEIFESLSQKKEFNSIKELKELQKILLDRELKPTKLHYLIGKIIGKSQDEYSSEAKYPGKPFFIYELDTQDKIYVDQHRLADPKDWAAAIKMSIGETWEMECIKWGKSKYNLRKAIKYKQHVKKTKKTKIRTSVACYR